MDGNRSDQVTLPLPGIHSTCPRAPFRPRLNPLPQNLRRRPAGVLFSTERNENNNKIKSGHEPTQARQFFGKISRKFNTTPKAPSNIEWFVLLRFTLPRNTGRLKRLSSGKLTEAADQHKSTMVGWFEDCGLIKVKFAVQIPGTWDPQDYQSIWLKFLVLIPRKLVSTKKPYGSDFIDI